MTASRIGAVVLLGLVAGSAARLESQGPAPAAPETPAAADAPEADEDTGARILRLELHDRIEPDGAYTRRQRVVALVLDAAGVAQYSQVGVPFLESNQRAELTSLVVTKPDGRELDLLSTAPRDVAPVYPPDLPIYSDLRVLRAAVPGLEAGDRLAFETTVHVGPLAEGEVWTEMTFVEPQRAEAQLYELDVPNDLAITVHVRAGLAAELEEERAGGRSIRRWKVAGKPAAPETEGRPADGFEADVVATTFSSWDEFGRWWASLAPPEVDDAVREKARALTAGLAEPRLRLRALHRYVAQEVRYLGLPLGLGRYRARAPAEVLGTQLGDCKDKIRLLASLAASLGLEIEPVLVGVQRRRLIEAAPSPDPFDHVIARARLGGETIWMDPTAELTPMGSLPKHVRGLPGVALTGGSAAPRAERVTTPERLAVPPSVEVATTGAIEPSGLIRAKVKWTFSGDDEPYRFVFRYGNAEQRRSTIEQLGRQWSDGGEIGAFSTSDASDVESPFWVEYDAEWPMASTVWAEPWDLWIPLPRLELDAPPDPEEEPEAAGRPLELGSMPLQRVTARIEVPAGVGVEAPVPVTARRGFADFHSDYRVDGRTLVLERELRLAAPEVPPEKFEELRALRKLIADDRNQEFDFAAAPALVPPEAETADALSKRCYSAVEKQAFAEAESLCRRAIELEPEHRYGWNNLGVALRGLDRDDEAVAAHRRQIEINPNDAWSYANLGRLARERGDLAEAERQFERQIEVAPLEGYGYRQFGSLRERQGKLDEAETLYARALKLEPDEKWTREALFATRAQLGRCGEVLASLEREPGFPADFGRRVEVADGVLVASCSPLAPAEPWFERLREGAEERLVGAELGQMQAAERTHAVTGLATAWDAAGRIALERGDLAAADVRLEAAMRLAPCAATAARRAELLRERGDAEGAKLQLAVAAELPGARSDAYRAALAAAVPSGSERSQLANRAREATWLMNSLTRTIPGADGWSGEVSMLFGADGRLLDAAADSSTAAPALVARLKADPPTLPLPPGNRARIPRVAQTFCNAEAHCTFAFEWILRSEADPSTAH